MRIPIAFFAVVIFLGTQRAAVAQFTGVTGSNQPYSNIKPSLAMHYIMCNQGNYPASSDGTLAQTDRTKPLIGEIRLVAFPTTPSGWMDCSGQLSNISQNTFLFSVLLNTYGGDGSHTFGIPNLYGAVPIGVGQGPGLPNYALGQSVGYELNSFYYFNLPPHTHTIPSGNTGSTGGDGTPIPNLQPSFGMNYVIDENGEIMMFAAIPGRVPPQGFAVCDGSLRDPNVDSILFGIIGTNYGGDGVTTFALPDLRGRAPVGTGPLASITYPLGARNGAAEITVTSLTMPSHHHTIGSNVFTGNTGNSFALDHRQPTLAMTWVIKYNGNAPTSTNGPIYNGEMRLMAGAPPAPGNGWFPADGSIYSIASFNALYTAIGTAYGGNGISTFAVPNLKGRMAVNRGGINYVNLGMSSDQSNIVFTVTNLPAHQHDLPSAPVLTRPQPQGDGTFLFGFTNIPNNTFTVLTTTNVTLPLSNWVSTGISTQTAPGQYQFIFTPTNGPKRFYAVGFAK